MVAYSGSGGGYEIVRQWAPPSSWFLRRGLGIKVNLLLIYLNPHTLRLWTVSTIKWRIHTSGVTSTKGEGSGVALAGEACISTSKSSCCDDDNEGTCDMMRQKWILVEKVTPIKYFLHQHTTRIWIYVCYIIIFCLGRRREVMLMISRRKFPLDWYWRGLPTFLNIERRTI